MRCRSFRHGANMLANHGLFGGIDVTVSKSLCQELAVRPKRPHRRRRIQKKWIRRYGMVMHCDGHGYQMAGVGIVGCPHWVAKLRKSVTQ